MGRTLVGRKYPKHMSVFVLEDHVNDFKSVAEKLTKEVPIDGDKAWTVRDVILTLLYGDSKLTSKWFQENHFEKISKTKISKLRKNINKKSNDILTEWS